MYGPYLSLNLKTVLKEIMSNPTPGHRHQGNQI